MPKFPIAIGQSLERSYSRIPHGLRWPPMEDRSQYATRIEELPSWQREPVRILFNGSTPGCQARLPTEQAQ